MAHTDFAQQTVVEHTMLKCLVDGLRATMGWKVPGNDFSRKLSTLRFIGHSLQRHLEHLMALEEFDGYMDGVMERCPELGKKVDALRQEHNTFRHAVTRLVHRLEQTSSTDRAAFEGLCEELRVLLDQLDEHNSKEIDLIQEAAEREGGGEG
jgi:hemerythrin-like domain-containing protein